MDERKKERERIKYEKREEKMLLLDLREKRDREQRGNW